MEHDPRFPTRNAYDDPAEGDVALAGPILGRAAALQYGRDALRRYVPDIPEPTLAQSFIPYVGSGWESVEALQEGDYARVALNAALTAAGAAPIAAGVAGLKVLKKVVRGKSLRR